MTAAQEKIVEEMQMELHIYTEYCMKNGRTDYQDVVTIFLLMKIAELQQDKFYLEERIETLECEIEELKPEDLWEDFGDDEEEPIEPVS